MNIIQVCNGMLVKKMRELSTDSEVSHQYSLDAYNAMPGLFHGERHILVDEPTWLAIKERADQNGRDWNRSGCPDDWRSFHYVLDGIYDAPL